MGRSKWALPPSPEQMSRYGIDTLYFTIPQVIAKQSDILTLLQQHIDPALRLSDLTINLGTSLYRQCLSVSIHAEDTAEFKPPYRGKQVELLRVAFDPAPKSDNKLFGNDTTAFQLKGELLKRIDYLPILRWIIEAGGSVTRVDFFKDDFLHIIKISDIYQLCTVGKYQGSVQSPMIKSYLDLYPGENSTYIGSKKGKQVHIYNKALESGEKFNHTRVELKLRKDNRYQTGLIKAIVGGANEEQLISSLIGKYLAFKPFGPGRIHDRAPFPWWIAFLGATSPIKRNQYTPVVTPKPKTLVSLEEQRSEIMRQLAGLEARIEEQQIRF